MATNTRLLVTHPIHIEARDAKLLNCEEYKYERCDAEDRWQGRTVQKIKCKCTLCKGSNWSRRSRVMAKQHIIQIGRHSICRGQTQKYTSSHCHFIEFIVNR